MTSEAPNLRDHLWYNRESDSENERKRKNMQYGEDLKRQIEEQKAKKRTTRTPINSRSNSTTFSYYPTQKVDNYRSKSISKSQNVVLSSHFPVVQPLSIPVSFPLSLSQPVQPGIVPSLKFNAPSFSEPEVIVNSINPTDFSFNTCPVFQRSSNKKINPVSMPGATVIRSEINTIPIVHTVPQKPVFVSTIPTPKPGFSVKHYAHKRTNPAYKSKTFQPIPERFQSTFQPSSDRYQSTFQPSSDRFQSTFQPSSDRYQTTFPNLISPHTFVSPHTEPPQEMLQSESKWVFPDGHSEEIDV